MSVARRERGTPGVLLLYEEGIIARATPSLSLFPSRTPHLPPTICGLYTRVRALCVYMYIYVQRRGLSPPPSTPPICPTGRRPHVIHCGPLVRCTASLALYIYILSEMGSIYCGDDQRPLYISGRGTAVHSNKKKERINYKTLGPHTSTSAMHIYTYTRAHLSCSLAALLTFRRMTFTVLLSVYKYTYILERWHTGVISARSSRSIYEFSSSPPND